MQRYVGLLIVALVAISSPGCGTASHAGRPNDRVLFLLGEEFDPEEFWGPYATLVAAGYKVDLAGAQKGVELTPDANLPEAHVRTNISLDEVDVSKYFALVVPGGPSGANVAGYPRAGEIAREFNASGKPIGSVCHGARLLMPEGIFKERTTTFIFMVADELCDRWRAGEHGMYLDLPVVVDKNLISSRDPRDIPLLSQALVERFAESGGLKVIPRQGRVLIVLPGATKHQKWVFDRLSVFGLSPVVWNESDAASTTVYDQLVILDGPGMSAPSLGAVVDAFSSSKKPILVSEAAKRSLPSLNLSSAKVIQADNIAFAMRSIVESAGPADSLKRMEYPDSKQWVDNYTKAAATPIEGAAWNPASEYNAVLALWNGYDDDAAARLNQFLASSGRSVLIVGPKAGTLGGLNGAKAEVAATYDDQIRLSASAIVVAPGGVWPRKTKAQQAEQPQWVEDDEPARQKRLNWLTSQYRSGRMLAAIGFDSLYIGQQPLFNGKRFASTDQASVIWFGDTGAEYAPEIAMFSDKNLLTAKPLVGVDDAIKLLKEHIQAESTRAAARF